MFQARDKLFVIGWVTLLLVTIYVWGYGYHVSTYLSLPVYAEPISHLHSLQPNKQIHKHVDDIKPSSPQPTIPTSSDSSQSPPAPTSLASTDLPILAVPHEVSMFHDDLVLREIPESLNDLVTQNTNASLLLHSLSRSKLILSSPWLPPTLASLFRAGQPVSPSYLPPHTGCQSCYLVRTIADAHILMHRSIQASPPLPLSISPYVMALNGTGSSTSTSPSPPYPSYNHSELLSGITFPSRLPFTLPPLMTVNDASGPLGVPLHPRSPDQHELPDALSTLLPFVLTLRVSKATTTTTTSSSTLPPTVLRIDPDGEVILSHLQRPDALRIVMGRPCNPHVLNSSFAFNPHPTSESSILQIINAPVLVLSHRWGNEPFHWLMECLPRIALVLPLLVQDTSIRIHVPFSPSTPTPSPSTSLPRIPILISDSLSFLDISPSRLVTGHIQTDTIILPQGATCGQLDPLRGPLLRSHLQKALNSTQLPSPSVSLASPSPSPPSSTSFPPTPSLSHSDKLPLCTRLTNPSTPIIILVRRSRVRSIVGFEHLLAGVQSALPHYRIMVFSDTPILFKDAALLFHCAVAVLAPHGAALANTIASPPGLKVYELLSDDTHATTCYRLAARTLGHEYRSYKPRINPHQGRFRLGRDEIQAIVKDFANMVMTNSKGREKVPNNVQMARKDKENEEKEVVMVSEDQDQDDTEVTLDKVGEG